MESGSRQLELQLIRPERPRARARAGAPLGPRLALSPDEAAAVLGVSRDYFDEHVIGELRIVRRGRRILVALAELEQWLDKASAEPVSSRARSGRRGDTPRAQAAMS
jgi:excisionase family DNA binding protein